MFLLCRDSSVGSGGVVRADIFDWTVPYGGPKFDVLLACDVLYEDVSVDPVAEAVPRMLFSAGGRLVLADPAHRTQHNRRASDLNSDADLSIVRCSRRVAAWFSRTQPTGRSTAGASCIPKCDSNLILHTTQKSVALAISLLHDPEPDPAQYGFVRNLGWGE